MRIKTETLVNKFLADRCIPSICFGRGDVLAHTEEAAIEFVNQLTEDGKRSLCIRICESYREDTRFNYCLMDDSIHIFINNTDTVYCYSNPLNLAEVIELAVGIKEVE